jgi:hypothetical protein
MCIQSRAALLGGVMAIFGCLISGVVHAQSPRTPVAVPRTEERQQTIYRPEYVTEMRDVYRTVYTPVTTYTWEARWRPLRSPHWVWQAAPHVQWQSRIEKTSVPVTTQHYVAETKTVRTPYLALGFKPASPPASDAAEANADSQASSSTPDLSPQSHGAPSRTAAAPSSSSLVPVPKRTAAATSPAGAGQSVRLGGILRMENDPPRQGRLVNDATLLR